MGPIQYVYKNVKKGDLAEYGPFKPTLSLWKLAFQKLSVSS